MKCQMCDERVVLRFIEIGDDQKVVEHKLCWKHAQEYLRESSQPGPEPTGAATPIPLGSPNAVCPACNLTFAEFRATGRLGCAHDYRAFESELRPLLENIHGAVQHLGKSPRQLPGKRSADVLRLRQELQQAVQAEKYERAAELRDAIDRLERED